MLELRGEVLVVCEGEFLMSICLWVHGGERELLSAIGVPSRTDSLEAVTDFSISVLVPKISKPQDCGSWVMAKSLR